MDNWHLDKKVPISIIVALICQTLFFTYMGTSWKDSVDNRIAALERSDEGQQSHENRITILEQKFDYIRSDLGEIKALLKRGVPERAQQ